MTQRSNAGIRRNRRPTGAKPVRGELRLAAETMAALDQARMASGSLSLSLYLERLTAELRTEHGTLPVFSPALDIEESHVTAA